MIDSSHDQIYVKDTAGRFVNVNVTTARFFGVASPQEVIGKSDFDFLPSGLATQFRAEEEALMRSGQASVNREAAVKDPTGDARWILTTKSAAAG